MEFPFGYVVTCASAYLFGMLNSLRSTNHVISFLSFLIGLVAFSMIFLYVRYKQALRRAERIDEVLKKVHKADQP